MKSKYKKYNKQIVLLEKSLKNTVSTKIGFFYGVTGFIHYFGQKGNTKIYYKQLLRWIVFVLNFWYDEKNFFRDNIFHHNHKDFKLFNSLIIETIYACVNNKNFFSYFFDKNSKIKSYNSKIYSFILKISKLFA
ncbi:hypothetical protein [Mesomycoplasma flocculare]|uniref:hypothetical protein n=1 Tax=Mesomycoplasma flocculare TaxID=2128 RepID=UPI00058E0E6D|nr:hypothetical protein [Mesomycoplasma flocculare]